MKRTAYFGRGQFQRASECKKITIMGQNGGGKSTIFKLITRAFAPESGNVFVSNGITIAIAKR